MSDFYQRFYQKSWKENEWLCVAESKATHGCITKATVSSSCIELLSAALNMCQPQEHPWMHHTDYNSSGGKKKHLNVESRQLAEVIQCSTQMKRGIVWRSQTRCLTFATVSCTFRKEIKPFIVSWSCTLSAALTRPLINLQSGRMICIPSQSKGGWVNKGTPAHWEFLIPKCLFLKKKKIIYYSRFAPPR